MYKSLLYFINSAIMSLWSEPKGSSRIAATLNSTVTKLQMKMAANADATYAEHQHASSHELDSDQSATQDY
jgi:outer membrane murein-binding lipoprotein Lpp